jgi:hypothetical protein
MSNQLCFRLLCLRDDDEQTLCAVFFLFLNIHPVSFVSFVQMDVVFDSTYFDIPNGASGVDR